MEIVKLLPGQPASAQADCVLIQKLPSGGYELTGTLLLACTEGDLAESISLISSDPYPTYGAAENAGVAWASENCVEVLHVSRSIGTEPLPDLA